MKQITKPIHSFRDIELESRLEQLIMGLDIDHKLVIRGHEGMQDMQEILSGMKS